MDEIIKKYPFKGEDKLEFEILDLSERLESKGAMMTIPHRAQFNHILWIEKGDAIHFVDFNPVRIHDNCIVFVPENCVNVFDKNGKYDGKTIIFTDSFFSKNQQDIQYLRSSILYSGLYPIARLNIDARVSELRLLLNAMETELKKEYDSARYPILQNLLHVFLLQAERELRNQGFAEIKPGANLDFLVLFKDLLEQNFKAEKSVNKYASEMNISEKQLHKTTKKLLDKTPKQIIDERIILEAKRLLVHTSNSVKEIAYELGYDEPTNFIKYFRKHVYNTPSEFREQ